MQERIYKPLEKLNKNQIKSILENGTIEQLITLPLSIGEYCREWKTAQNCCITFMKHENAAVRANAALGLSYIARRKKILDKRIVKPYLLKELRENKEYQWRIIDSIQDINLFLNWHLAEKSLEKLNNRKVL